MTTTSVQSIWLLLLDDTLWNPIARCTRCKNLRYARIAWEILRRNFIQSKLSTNWSPKKDQGATTGLLCVLQNGSPIFHSFLDTMLTQNTWCWWAGGVPWGHHFVGSNPHGCYHFVGVPIPFCRGVGWAPYTLVLPSSRGEFQGGWKNIQNQLKPCSTSGLLRGHLFKDTMLTLLDPIWLCWKLFKFVPQLCKKGNRFRPFARSCLRLLAFG